MIDIWTHNVKTLITSPDAKELIDRSFNFAKGAMAGADAAFEAGLASILGPLRATAPPLSPAPAQVARILTRAVHGFKESANSLEDLRAMIDGLPTLTLAACT